MLKYITTSFISWFVVSAPLSAGCYEWECLTPVLACLPAAGARTGQHGLKQRTPDDGAVLSAVAQSPLMGKGAVPPPLPLSHASHVLSARAGV